MIRFHAVAIVAVLSVLADSVMAENARKPTVPMATQSTPVQELRESIPAADTDHLSVPENLRERVDFWILVFTKYGKNQLVFHHRLHPHIIYSVLDFTELAEEHKGSDFEKRKRMEIEAETTRIQQTLLQLAEGKAAESPFERRIARLFEGLTRWGWKVRSEYRSAATIEQIRTQTGIREKFRDGLIRSRRFVHAMEQIFREAGLPPELSRIPHVESSFDYTAYSSVGAAGIWQFMRNTGKRYMRIDNLVDERRDPIVATRAAAHYLQHAFNSTNSWPLAVTSYNHGLTGIMRGAKSVGSRDLATIIRRYEGKTFGFASQNFYAEILAAIEADRNWEQYFPGTVLEAPLYFDEVVLGSSTGVEQLAKAVGVSRGDVIELNPGLLKPITSGRFPVPAGKTVKVPRGKGASVVARIPGSRFASLTALPAPKREVATRVVKKKASTKTPTKSKPKKTTKKAQAPKKPATKKKSAAAQKKSK